VARMRCFVIQPFDGDKFDRRFEDTFAPAIKDGGFEPYRVDRDPSVNIPIEEIEKEIRASAVCFAEITTNNANVWFELGFAIACQRPMCIVCSDERDAEFPFDVRHRKIVKYKTRSPSDFDALRTEIVDRLKSA
jgi:hypothetical protein